MTPINIHQIFPIGTVFKTNYSVLTHKLKTIQEGCTRPSCKEQWHTEPTEPHLHFSATCLEYGSHSNFNGYILTEDGRIVSLFGREGDHIIILEIPRFTQLNLF
jgi:hypothetical protein